MIDISGISSTVRRLDTSATLKNFVAVAAIITSFAALVLTFEGILFMLAEPFDMHTPNDALFVLAVVVVGVLASFVPLLFVLWDWVARQPWHTLAAINAVLLGILGLGLFGAALGGSIDYFLSESGELGLTSRLLVAISLGLIAVLLAALLVVESRRARRVLIWIVVGIVFSGAVTLAIVFFRSADFDNPDDAVLVILQVLLIVFNICVATYLLSRAIRNRIVLSGSTPRGLLLGDFYRRGFWVRLAFLTGLPSSLWHASAMKTTAFWAFLLARPIVYGGIVFALSDNWQHLGIMIQSATGIAAVVFGHALFYGAKRLTTAYAWQPDHPLDDRDPVLFLRSFEDDQLKFHRAWWNLPRRWLDLWSFRRNADETMVDEVAQYGPVVALGMPGEENVPFGAQRYYSSHDDWQEIVAGTAKRSRAIVLAAGDSQGVRWEYEMLAREQLLDKTLLLFPPTDDETPEAGHAALSAFQEATGVIVDSNFGAGRKIIALVPAGEGRHEIITSDTTDAAVYLTAIRSFFQQRSRQDLSDPILKLAAPTCPS